jgi:Translocon-associated protein (TRAP), alpha subunit
VTVKHAFPGVAHPRHIVAGEEVTALFTVRNSHSAPINVTFASGSVNAVRDFKIHVQNLTVVAYRAAVPKNTERTFEYRFSTDARMPPREFFLALTMFYTDGADPTAHAATFYNGTVEVVEPERLIDTEAISLWLTLAGIAAAIGALRCVCYPVKRKG